MSDVQFLIIIFCLIFNGFLTIVWNKQVILDIKKQEKDDE